MRILLAATLLFGLAHTAAAETSYDDVKEAFAAYKEALEAGDVSKARAAARAAYLMGLKRFGENHKNTAALALNYGRLLEGEEAQDHLEKTLTLFEGVYGKDAYDLVDPLMELAKAEAGYGEFLSSKRLYNRALALVEQHDSADGIIAGMINLEIGQVAMMEAASRQSLKYLQRAEYIFQNLDGQDAEYSLAKTQFWIGKYWLANKNEEKATQKLLVSLDTFETIIPSSELTLANHAFLIEAYEKRGLREAATKHCQAIGNATPQDSTQDYRPVYQVRPVYPLSAQKSGKEGYVIVSVTVDPEGFVRDPKVLEVKGSDKFIDASLEAVGKFRYIPRYKDGRPVATEGVKYRFAFNLAG